MRKLIFLFVCIFVASVVYSQQGDYKIVPKNDYECPGDWITYSVDIMSGPSSCIYEWTVYSGEIAGGIYTTDEN